MKYLLEGSVNYMTMTKVEIEVPEEVATFVITPDKKQEEKRNAMLLYPYIQDGTISHGRAADMLGMYKMDLITIYGEMGLPYLEGTREELENDLATLKKLRG